VITGSHDTTIRLWDLRKGSTMCTLTQHKKSVRALVAHPTEHAFASAGADNVKKFKLPNVSPAINGAETSQARMC
jgi:pleiotropic regulator 1